MDCNNTALTVLRHTQNVPFSRTNFYMRTNEFLRYELYRLIENTSFMSMMRMLYKHLAPDIIGKLIQSSKSGFNSYNPHECNNGISIDIACKEIPWLAATIKQTYPEFFPHGHHHNWCLDGKEVALLRNVCNFEHDEPTTTTTARIEALATILFIEAPSRSLPGTNDYASIERSNSSVEPGQNNLNMAKKSETEFFRGRWPKMELYVQVVDNYIKAAKLGNAEAKMWLAIVAESGNFSAYGKKFGCESTLLEWHFTRGLVWMALGDIHSKEGAEQDVINACYTQGWKLLFDNIQRGNAEAINYLYDKPIGPLSAQEMNNRLDQFLDDQLRSLLATKKDDIRDWVFKLFNNIVRLPPSYIARCEEALLIAQRSKGVQQS